MYKFATGGYYSARCNIIVEAVTNEEAMLGMDKNTPPVIEGQYAKEMREAIRRKYSDQPNASDMHTRTRSEQIKDEYHAVWK